MTLEEQVKLAKTALEDKKAVDVKAYDVRGVSGFADAFVVATGTAAPHLKALIAGVQGTTQGLCSFDRGQHSFLCHGSLQEPSCPWSGTWSIVSRP